MTRSGSDSRPIAAVGVVLVEGDRVLLIERDRPPGAGLWSIPGGKVELGESLEQAALRELGEETGLGCSLGPIVEVLDRVVRSPSGQVTYHYVILDFVGSHPTGQLAPGSDCRAAAWVRLDELERYPTTDGLAPVIRRALASDPQSPLRVHDSLIE